MSTQHPLSVLLETARSRTQRSALMRYHVGFRFMPNLARSMRALDAVMKVYHASMLSAATQQHGVPGRQAVQ